MQDLKEFFTDLKSFNCDGRLSREQYLEVFYNWLYYVDYNCLCFEYTRAK